VGSLWTPSGEYQPRGGGDASPPPAPPPGGGGPGGPGGDEGPSAEEIAALRELHARLAATPVEDVVANHAFGLWQLALVYLGVATDEQGRQPAPDLEAARLVIDAVAALLDGVGSRLGEHEPALRDALGQSQLIYVRLAEALAAQSGETG
jgi:hypothetical protein